MKVYVDTNVAVARSVTQHQDHARAVHFFDEVGRHHWTPVILTHGLAEIYSILTRAPFLPRVSPADAWEIIERNVVERFEIEPLTSQHNLKVVRECASIGWPGGRVYDAIHVHAARKAQCERIYTFNVQDFRQLAPDLVDRIMAP